jgi:tetratricopeptide (TPR) repeat protein
MPRGEVRRLLELLGDGLEGIEHVVELGFFEATPELFAALRGEHCVVFLSVPDGVDEESVAKLRNQLGSVRVGLIQRAVATTWPEVAWQERHVKVPLLRALEHELRRSDHPLARLGIENAPVAQLAKLTAEPVELLEMLEKLVEHRLGHARWGMRDSDWSRSVYRAAAERLALRLRSIPSEEMLRGAVDRILEVRPGPDEDADRALACVGLAWIEGNDVLLSTLAEFGKHPEVLLHLVLLLPEHAWSKRGGAVIRAAVPTHLPTLRAAWVVPEPPYSEWPALVTKDVLDEVLDELSAGVDGLPWSAERYALIREIEGLRSLIVEDGRRLGLIHRTRSYRPAGFSSEPEPYCEELLDALRAAFMGLRDSSLRAFDSERDTVHRFNALDRASVHLDNGLRLAAFVRWYALTLHVDEIIDVREPSMFEAQIERGVELANGDGGLVAALLALRGDIQAKRRDYRGAEHTWQQADPESQNDRLLLRRGLAYLRLGERQEALTLADRGYEIASDIDSETPIDHQGVKIGGLTVADELVAALIGVLADGPSKADLESIEREFYNSDTSLVRIGYAAAAIERGDWPQAVYFVAKLDRTSRNPMTANAQVLWAWLHAALGDPDAAATSFAELRETFEARGDRLLLALAERGWAMSATELGQPNLAAEAHARADALERELGIVVSNEP